jgi:glycosyltransferase involved in cell wall biosynthesis
MKVSVVITIYNREKYIKDCVCSLFEQTLDDIEFVFVDDASTDKSLLILHELVDKYPIRKSYVKVIHMETNGGRAVARQIGIDSANGEYIIHVDSDDWIDKNMMELLYKRAKETDADVVGCNIIHEYGDSHCVFKQKYSDEMDENIRRLINGTIFPSLCTSLTRTSIIKDNYIMFPKGLDTGEDLLFNLNIYLHANRLAYIDSPCYHYRHTEDSGSFRHTDKSIKSVIKVACKIECLMKEQGKYEDYEYEIQYRKFFMKCALITDFNNADYNKTWLNLFPETHKYIWSYKQYTWKRRIEFWLAAHNLFGLARLFQRVLRWQNHIKHL